MTTRILAKFENFLEISSSMKDTKTQIQFHDFECRLKHLIFSLSLKIIAWKVHAYTAK